MLAGIVLSLLRLLSLPLFKTPWGAIFARRRDLSKYAGALAGDAPINYVEVITTFQQGNLQLRARLACRVVIGIVLQVCEYVAEGYIGLFGLKALL